MMIKGKFVIKLIAWLLVGVMGQSVYGQNPSDTRHFVDYYKEPIEEGNMLIRESHYDYTEVAQSITAGCQDNYEKIRMIYLWICTHIAYDISYSINTADRCYDTRKGVCQAYCELFYQLAKAVGVASEVIPGKTKDSTGHIDGRGHAWIFAYTHENRGILLDPTWGAGSVSNGQFVRRENCWTWFNVSPEWMILSHYPDDASYQLIDNPLSYEQFLALTPVNHTWMEYGLDPAQLSEKVRNNELEMPMMYNAGEGKFEILDIPLRRSLRVGERYTFRIRVHTDKPFALFNNSVSVKSDEWTDEGDGVISLPFVVRDTGSVRLCLKGDKENMWNRLVEYQVIPPSDEDWQRVEALYPLCVPDARQVKSSQAAEWERAGVDGHRLLKSLRENGLAELPIVYTDMGQWLEIGEVPMTLKLTVGQSYTLRFTPRTGTKWALILGNQWYDQWEVTPQGEYVQTITPTTSGKLKLSVQFKENESYWACLSYEVQNK